MRFFNERYSDRKQQIEDGHLQAFCIVIPDILLAVKEHGLENAGGGVSARSDVC